MSIMMSNLVLNICRSIFARQVPRAVTMRRRTDLGWTRDDLETKGLQKFSSLEKLQKNNNYEAET